MVELRAVEDGFLHYGVMKLSNGARYEHGLLRGFGVLVRPELLAQLDVAVGDALTIGSQRFTIRGVIESEPGRRLGAFSIGPRVFVDLADLQKTGLMGFGSRAMTQRLLRVPEATLDGLIVQLRKDFANEFARVRSYKATEDDIGEDFARAEDYLSLVGLVIVILGGIGVSSVTRVFVQQKMKSIAVLKCVGARSSQLLAVYVAQVAMLGLAGSLLGIGLAQLAMRAIPSMLAGTTPGVDITYALTAPAVAQDSASACWCRCCSRWCRCSRSGTSSRRCCCATSRGAVDPTRPRSSSRWWSWPGWSASRSGRRARGGSG